VRPAGAFSLRGHSVGGFGSVTTNKVIASVASELFGMQVQAFPKYGSEKKGLPTSYYLTLAKERIRMHAELNHVDFVAVQDANAFFNGDPLAGLRDGGAIYLQTPRPPQEAWKALPPAAQKSIRDRHLKLYALDALRIAHESSSRPELQLRMQGIALLGAFLRLTPFREQVGLSKDELFARLEKTLTKYFGKRGARVVADNMAVAARGYDEVQPVPVGETSSDSLPIHQNGTPAACGTIGAVLPQDFCSRIVASYERGKQELLEADEFIGRSFMPPASARYRSFRHLGPEIPEFIASKCVGCMECVNQCPDTAILAKVVEPVELDGKLAQIERPELRERLRSFFAHTSKYWELPERRGESGGWFGIFVDPDKCKGCGECVTACGRHDALKTVAKSHTDLDTFDLAMDLYRNLPDTPLRFVNEKALGDMMLAERALLYTGGAGSCSRAGRRCGPSSRGCARPSRAARCGCRATRAARPCSPSSSAPATPCCSASSRSGRASTSPARPCPA
jgi:pyruvate-ferredoxin/flavodoxin oxidoreductase